jgi:hypothetical protein
MVPKGPADALGSAAAKWFEELDDRGVFITDDRLIVRRWNHWLAARTGQPAEDVVGRPLLQAKDPRAALASRRLTAMRSGKCASAQRFHHYLLPDQ